MKPIEYLKNELKRLNKINCLLEDKMRCICQVKNGPFYN